MINKEKLNASCGCGQTQVTVDQPPMLRFHCHCTICQNLYHKPFSDVTVMWANNATLIESKKIEYRRPGLLLKRGVCTQCEKPIFATMTLFPGIKLAFIPADRYENQARLPLPTAHIFYHRRLEELNDGIPKTVGFIKSELVISWLILKSAIVRKFR